jgi:hypothetical protein
MRKIPPQSAQGLGLLPQFPHSGSPVVRLLTRRYLPQLAHTASSRALALQGRHLGASVAAHLGRGFDAVTVGLTLEWGSGRV